MSILPQRFALRAGQRRARTMLGVGLLVLGALLGGAVPALRHGLPGLRKSLQGVAGQRQGGASSLAADLPPGALMTIEAPDFARLLHEWKSSPEAQAWLKSASYSAFLNSRLLGRLAAAQAEFAGTAGTAIGSPFLEQVAGGQSIFAWYDIGGLEFLYITRLPAGRAATLDLLEQRAHYSRRTSGDTDFYVRTSSDQGGGSDGGQRTVAFATRGDMLILATREDLMANALLLMQKGGGPAMAEEGWYAAANQAGGAEPGALHMLLDLQRLTHTPQFRTYWVQRNVSEMRQFRAAVVDLYREPGRFREERALLPMAAAGAEAEPGQDGLAGLTGLVPERAGFYRLLARPSSAEALDALEEKVLVRDTRSSLSSTAAPYADVSVPQAGSANDLETRIDSQVSAQPSGDGRFEPLRRLLADADLSAMLTVERTGGTAPTGEAGASVFVPIHAAVALRRQGAWDQQQLASALLAILGPEVSEGGLGLAWKPVAGAGGSYLVLSSIHPLALFVAGDTAVFSTDPGLLAEMLAGRPGPVAVAEGATVIAEVRHAQERASFLRLATALDAQTPLVAALPGRVGDMTAQAPAFFRDTIGSLSESFSSLATERFVQRRAGAVTRQTVTYSWSSSK